ncbi:MAG: cystathionine gamma-synthase [Candidatus Latescibacterota bacterium]|jgi:cystathionine gamma-synthase/cystathionine gamma-lyase
MRFETRAIHAGQASDPRTGAVTVPVYQTSTFEQDGIGQPRGFEYSRTGNPTRQALEESLAALEGGGRALAFASGSAATSAILQSVLRPGDHVLAGADVYGGTYRLLERVFRPWGVAIDYADPAQVDDFADRITPKTRLIWVETPTNPLLKIVDLRRLAALSRTHGLRLAVDNTFASPWFQRPLELGAQIVIHSTTKYLGGHSDLIGGAAVIADDELFEQAKFHQNAVGAVPGPWDCWLLLRGIKTLAVRMRQHAANALVVARFLEDHPAVERVNYPGLPSHPQHALAAAQMSGFSGMVSFDLKGGFAAVERFVGQLEVFVLAESLGGVESLVCYPPRMTHAALGASERRARGIGDQLVRLSVGLEHPDDLLADLEQGLTRSVG